MTERPATRPPQLTPAMSLADIYFILFRHKWKLAIIAGLGTLLAVLLPVVWRLPYQSEAKLLIRYVLDAKSPIGANGSKVQSPDERGENIINTELEILTSLDLAQQVADAIGPQKILAKAGGGTDRYIAATLIRKNLLAEVPKKSNVIRIVFQHPDAEIVQPVLSELIGKYLKAQAEIHRSVGVFDDFLSETDQLRSRLVQTEEELRKAKAKAGILSLDDTKKEFTEQNSKIQQAIFDAEADLAERQAAVNELSKLLHASPPTPLVSTTQHLESSIQNPTPGDATAKAATPPGAGSTNNQTALIGIGLAAAGFGAPAAGTTNATPVIPATNVVAAVATNGAAVPEGAIAEYRKVSTLLESLEKRERELLVQFTPASSLVKSVQEQIDGYQKLKARLEEENPAITTLPDAQPKTANATPASGPKVDLAAEMAKVTSLQARIRVLTNQLGSIRTNAAAVDLVEASITELQRRKELEEANYKYFSANLEQSRIDEALGPDRVSNIIKIQAPSPPFRDGAKLRKIQALALFGGIAAAFGLAFLIELYLDRSLKRPTEIEAKLGLPLFLSIPLIGQNGKPRFLIGLKKIPLLSHSNGNGASNHQSPITNHESPIPDPQSPVTNGLPTPHLSGSSRRSPMEADSALLRPFSEALRDRLIAYFELKDLTHKPKLVAVTSCAQGSGVTTIAAGLAAALSETNDGKVLLVDMHAENGVARDFHHGKLACGLDDALEVEKRGEAMVQDNLYMVRETANGHVANGDKLPRVLPKRFNHLMPRLKASDYDYIIFDMPAISQISVTARLSRFMDMVLLVVESEKTDRDVAKRATTLLSEPRTNVGIILNKSRTYVPRLLQQEL